MLCFHDGKPAQDTAESSVIRHPSSVKRALCLVFRQEHCTSCTNNVLYVLISPVTSRDRLQ